MATSMAERLTETRRRLILDMMLEADGQLSDTSIRSVLGRIHSESTEIDQVRADLSFMERHGLIILQKHPHAGRELWVGRFTAAGQSVARGRNHPGIAERDAP